MQVKTSPAAPRQSHLLDHNQIQIVISAFELTESITEFDALERLS